MLLLYCIFSNIFRFFYAQKFSATLILPIDTSKYKFYDVFTMYCICIPFQLIQYSNPTLKLLDYLILKLILTLIHIF